MNRLNRAFVKALTMDGYPDNFTREYLKEIIMYTSDEKKVDLIKKIRKIYQDQERRSKKMDLLFI